MAQRSLRVWLEHNKVFFEVFSSVLLGVAGIFVAYASYHVSDAQLEVSRIGVEPHFYVKSILFQNAETRSFDEEELYLHNAGAPAHNINAVVRSFIELKMSDPESKLVIIPIFGYYSGSFYKSSPTGLISTFRGHLNNHYAAKLKFSTLDPEEMKGRPYFDHDIFSIVAVDYKNGLNEERKVYFRDTRQISPDAARQLLELWGEEVPLELSTITIDSLMATVHEREKL